MENNFENESYWKSSASKAFNFDDDVDSVVVNNTTANISTKWNSVLTDDTISEASFDNSAIDTSPDFSIKSVLSDEQLKTILFEQTLDDRLITKGITAEEELRLLRRHLQTTLYNPSPEVTAQKLLLGKNVTLEVFKSLEEKEQLLDIVLSNGGGDAVVGVLLFLKKTLNNYNFYKILQQREKAFTHYISYLKQHESQEAIELLKLFGKHQEAALLQFQIALNNDDIQVRKQKLHQLCEQYSSNVSVISLYQQIFCATYKMIELMQNEQKSLENLVNINSTPIEVLYAFCRKHNNWKDQDLVAPLSPYRLVAEQQISPIQFEWTALNERATAQAYGDLEYIFERTPTWHPIKHKQFHISFSLQVAILRLYELNAPPTVLYLFLSKMSNSMEKLELAQRVNCTKAIIDAHLSLKNADELQKLKDTLSERSEEQFYCDKALKSLQNKRWTTDNIKIKL